MLAVPLSDVGLSGHGKFELAGNHFIGNGLWLGCVELRGPF